MQFLIAYVIMIHLNKLTERNKMETFKNAIEKRHLFENQTMQYSKLLNVYPRSSIGLVSDIVRNSIEYRTLKDQYAIAHHNLRAINTFINKNYKKENRILFENKRLQKLK